MKVQKKSLTHSVGLVVERNKNLRHFFVILEFSLEQHLSAFSAKHRTFPGFCKPCRFDQLYYDVISSYKTRKRFKDSNKSRMKHLIIFAL